MSTEKHWIKNGRGMYTITPTRGARAGKTCYWARVWIKGRGRCFFFLGLKLKAARTRHDQILANPEAALAEREAREQQQEQARTFEQVLDLFLANYHSRGDTDWYHGITKAAREHFERQPVVAVTGAALDAYVNRRKSEQRKDGGGRRVSDGTIRKEMIALGTLFKWAKSRGLVQENPADAEHVKRPKDTVQEARALTDAELAEVRKGAAPWLDNVIGWATETGMDKGKILRLRWAELDLDRERGTHGRIVAGRFAMQRDKTGAPIRQVLSAGAIEVLNRARLVRPGAEMVFLDADANQIAEKALDWALGCAYKAAEITGCNFRTFRHTYATRALRRGVPTKVLALTMGHSTTFITDRYQHVHDDQLAAAAQALSGPEVLVRPGHRDTIPPVPGSATAPPAAPPAFGTGTGIA